MDPDLLPRPTTPTASPGNQSIDQSPIIDEPCIKSEGHNRHSTDSISSPGSEIARQSTFRSLSPTQSPPLQVMERPEDLSNRCSSSSERSSGSNESLFSIHMTKSYSHDQAHLLVADSSKFHDFMYSMEHSSQSDVNSLKVDSLSKLDFPVSSLDEPQKVVRWKTQVERLADEGVPSQGHQQESSPCSSHNSNEPKKKLRWSFCKCGSCNLLKWSSWKACWLRMSCSNCKPKKVSSSHSTEASGPTSASPKKPDLKDPKMGLCRGCCFRPRFACFRSWSCPCHCC